MTDFPRSLIEFQQRFGDEAACAQYLIATRWPDGFVCPGCGGSKAWRLETKAWTFECAGCGRQTSVTAGTIMHHSKLPLTAWFWAAYLMATHSNGISALQLQRQLAFGSYKTAWLICAKLRCSMLAPGRSPLAGLVEVDETEIAPLASTPSSPPTSAPVLPLRPMAGPDIPAPPASPTIPMSSARWRPTSSCPGFTGSSPTSRSGPWASITGCAASTSNPTSMNSSSASTAGAHGTPHSDPCSASPLPTNLCLTKC